MVLAISSAAALRTIRRIYIELQLSHEPARESRNRKILVGLIPPGDHLDPVWELRVGEYRIFYDVDEIKSTVFRARYSA